MRNTPDTSEMAHRRDLAAALAEVRHALENCAKPQGGRRSPAGAAGKRPAASHGSAEPAHAPADRSPLDHVCEVFGLTAFERSLLLLCAGVELDAAFPGLCAAAHRDDRAGYPTFGLALAAFPEAAWSALAPRFPLRRWRLIEVGAGERLTSSPLRIDERVLHYLAGVSCIDERLQGLVERLDAPLELPASQQAALGRVAEVWSSAENAATCPVIQLCGNDQAGKRSVAAAVCGALGLQLHSMRAMDLPGSSSEREILSRLWEREALLNVGALLIDDEDAQGPESARGLLPFLETTQGLLIVTSQEPLRSRQRRVVRLDVNRPSAGEQKSMWRRALGPAAEHLNGHLDLLATQFDLSLHAINAASDDALQQWSRSDDRELGSMLWDACRAQARPRLDDLAHGIDPRATWEDLVLPPAQLQVLRSIAAHVRRRARVYDDWGFASKGTRGLGISALFSGVSGTGKTMAAEVLANELRLDLYRIDLSAMVSKYIGETEKNLRRVFDAAEEGGAILLFDEADALFGKRSEVKDSHDRYANIEVSYLLQRVESYRGLAILTSNMKNALDPAFMRRIRFIVSFPFPDTAQRIEIWRRIFPEDTPTDGLNLSQLARLNLSGGNIRNLALNAAFFAADSEEPVRMKHLLAAAQAEYAKLEKPLGEAEIGGWA